MSEDDAADEGRGQQGEAQSREGTSGEASDAGAPGLDEALQVPAEGTAAHAYHQRARLAEDRLAEVFAAYRKLKAETEAYKDRLTRNIERRYDQRRERLLLKFIEILDNLDRALEAAEQSFAGDPLIQGLILVRTQLLQTLQEEGLERIPALGLPYDPNFSEAVGTEPVEDPDHHHVVVKDLLRGYRLNGRLARASRVVVGEYTGDAEVPGPSIDPDAPTEPMALPTLSEGPEEVPEPPDLSLEEIIARAEAQEALFPDAFGVEPGPKDDED